MIRRLQFRFPAEGLRTAQLWLTIGALILAPLPFGSTDQRWIAIWTILLSLSTICGVAAPINREQRKVLLAFLAVCCVYGVVAAIQVIPNLFEQLNDPIWQRTNDLLALGALPRISSRAEIPAVSIGKFILLVTSFMSGFVVGTSGRDSDTLIVFARRSVLLYSLYGLLALALTPNMILWAPKLAYQGSLTATFINHNTAATFVGAGAILWFCSACLSLQSLRFSSLRLLLLIPSNERYALTVIIQSAAGLVCLFALLLTGSRGGLICATLGLLVAIGLVVAGRTRLRFWYALSSAAVASAVAIAWLAQAGRIGSHGLFDDARWSVYASSIEAIRQRPLLGAGVGTFADLFPSLRGDQINTWGVWDYAHSTILEIAFEMGIPIAAMVAVAAAASVFLLARAALKSQQGNRTLLSAIAGVAVLSFAHSVIDFSLQIPGYLIFFAILLGCGLARTFSRPRRSKEHASIRSKESARQRSSRSKQLSTAAKTIVQ
jgi:O-antigen ligase